MHRTCALCSVEQTGGPALATSSQPRVPPTYLSKPNFLFKASSAMLERHVSFSTSYWIGSAGRSPLQPTTGDSCAIPQACQASCATSVCNPSGDVLCLMAAYRWQNPLIGWTSTADPMEHVARSALTFDTKESAVAFAVKSGFTPSVRLPNVQRPDRLKRYAGYGDNFRWPTIAPAPRNLFVHRKTIGYW